jgi:hypothetical protein
MKKDPIKILLKVNCDDEFADAPTLAIAEVGRMDAETLIAYSSKVKTLRKGDGDIYSLEKWDTSCDYVKSPEKVNGITMEQVDEAQCGTPVEATPYPMPSLVEAVDCQTAVITENAVYWTGYIKNTGVKLTTGEITVRQLRAIAKGQKIG